MDQILRIWGGSYHDYWFTDDSILKIRLVPQAITIIGIVFLVALTALLGVLGVIIGAITAALIYLVSGKMAKGRRASIGTMSVSQLREKGLITLRIPYSVISSAEMKAGRLTLSIESRRVRIKIPEDEVYDLQLLLRSKLKDQFTILSD